MGLYGCTPSNTPSMVYARAYPMWKVCPMVYAIDNNHGTSHSETSVMV